MIIKFLISFENSNRHPRRVPMILLILIVGLPLLLWGAGALWFRLPWAGARLPALALWLVWMGATAVWAWRQQRPAALGLIWLCSLGLLLVWWLQIRPRDDRVWADDVALHAQVLAPAGGDQGVVVRNVRNFQWRSDSDYDIRWEQRHYDLSQLSRVDVALSYWMGPAIAHTLVSFGFADGRHLVFSIEIRKERGEQFDALAGFFKQYEMTLVAADERDILAVRTNARGERVHLYQVRMPAQAMRELFMAYAGQADALIEQPRYYHTLTGNCTTIVWQLARSIGARLPLDWRMLASGFLPGYLHDSGVLAPGRDVKQLEREGEITQRAKAWAAPAGGSDQDASVDFSQAIRRGMPTLMP